MDHFNYRDGQLYAEDVALADIAARCGTPTYVYSKATLTRHYRAFDDALAGLDHRVCFAVKANSNLAVLQVLARLGAGFDIVSGGELARVLRAGGAPDKIVFSGVGKRQDELLAALDAGIACFNVESESELRQLAALAHARRQRARIALRVNPDVDAKTHPYISTGLKENKFGVEIGEAQRLYALAATLPGIEIHGVACHIGSQLCELSPFLDALDRVLDLIDRLAAAGIRLHHIDIGGGLGVRYHDETPPEPAQWAAAIRARLLERPAGRSLTVMTEPGRAIAGNAGILLTRVELLKPTANKNFAIIDAAMNDLIRPAFYDAWHTVLPVAPHHEAPSQTWDLVGPVCESGDWLARDRTLALREGDLLALRTAGAYGFVMSSNYNSRPRAAEVLVDGDQIHLARARETLEDLWRGEALLG